MSNAPSSFDPWSRELGVDDYRRLLRVLEVVERARSAEDLRSLTLAALDEHLGYAAGAFHTGPPPGPDWRTLEASTHGFSPSVLEEYLELWADHEAYASIAAMRLQLRQPVLSLHEFYNDLELHRRFYVNEFLGSIGVSTQMSLWIDTHVPVHGYLALQSRDGTVFGHRDHALLMTLRPHLANMLRTHLMATPTPGMSFEYVLTRREGEIAQLVASGWSNAQIARSLDIAEDTVKKHVSRVMRKLRVRSRVQLTRAWLTSQADHVPNPSPIHASVYDDEATSPIANDPGT